MFMGMPVPIFAAGGFRPLIGTLNPADKEASITLSNDNLTASKPSGLSRVGVRGTASVSTGKVYWEIAVDAGASGASVGIAPSAVALTELIGSDANSWGYNANGRVYNNNAGLTAYLSYAVSDVIGVALDMDRRKLHFSRNGVWIASSDPQAATGGFDLGAGPYFPVVQLYSGLAQMTANFSGPFLYL